MKRIYFIQPQYGVKLRGFENYWMPYSVACIWSYCKEHDFVNANFELGDLVFKREKPDELVDRLDNPSICAFSCYVWNEQYNLHVAKMIKEKYPNCIIEFGGPQATNKMLEEYDYIDIVINGEGEEAFLSILRDIVEGNELQRTYEKTRISDYDFPSPYQNGVFDKLVEDHPDIIWAAIFETNRGCPHRCTFCDWGTTTMSKINAFGLERVAEDIEWLKTHKVAFLLCADANFGIFKDRDIEIAKMLRKAGEESEYIDNIDLIHSKNSTETIFEISKIMGDFNRRGASVSVQSMNEPTLKAIKRKNLHVQDISKHVKLAKKYGVNLYSDLILGLPEETLESWKDGMDLLMEHGQHYLVDFWFCQTFANAELGSEFSRKTYGIKTVKCEDYMTFAHTHTDDNIKEYVELVCETDTMSRNDFFEAYTFSWVAVKFHYIGYTQLIAKYCRYVLGIRYKEFYERLMQYLMDDTGLLGTEIKGYRAAIEEYYATGRVPQRYTSGHGLQLGTGMQDDTLSKFENTPKVLNFIEEFTKTIPNFDSRVMDMQRKFMYDPETNFPYQATFPYNIETWEKSDTEYSVENSRTEEERYDLFIIKRKDLTKNRLVEL